MSLKVERLVNLTIALLEARRPLTLDDIRRRTRYYGQDDRESARRMFERDKDELRRMGVPVRTHVDPLGGVAGYVVDRREYELPDVDLERDEVAALAVALRLTGQAADRVALSKLSARAPDPLDSVGDVGARLDLQTDAVDELADALVLRQTVRFDYRTAAGEVGTRTVDPYGVALRRGSWYLVGHDHGRGALRAFRLDRVDGPVATTTEPGAFTVPDDVDVSAHVQGPSTGDVDVDLAVVDGARWAVEARGGVEVEAAADGRTVMRLHSVDPWRLASWVLGLGPDVEVLAPHDLRESVHRTLEALVEASA